MEGSFPQPPVQSKDYDNLPIARRDYIAQKAGFYAVAVDPEGKLWWNSSTISDPDEGYNGAHIIEVLPESVPDAFLAHLQEVVNIFGMYLYKIYGMKVETYRGKNNGQENFSGLFFMQRSDEESGRNSCICGWSRPL